MNHQISPTQALGWQSTRTLEVLCAMHGTNVELQKVLEDELLASGKVTLPFTEESTEGKRIQQLAPKAEGVFAHTVVRFWTPFADHQNAIFVRTVLGKEPKPATTVIQATLAAAKELHQERVELHNFLETLKMLTKH